MSGELIEFRGFLLHKNCLAGFVDHLNNLMAKRNGRKPI